MPQWGVLMRSEVGFLVHEGDSNMSKQPGSRLKTPSLPIWVTLCLGHYGVLFNTNRELLRNYHAERRYEYPTFFGQPQENIIYILNMLKVSRFNISHAVAVTLR